MDAGGVRVRGGGGVWGLRSERVHVGESGDSAGGAEERITATASERSRDSQRRRRSEVYDACAEEEWGRLERGSLSPLGVPRNAGLSARHICPPTGFDAWMPAAGRGGIRGSCAGRGMRWRWSTCRRASVEFARERLAAEEPEWLLGCESVRSRRSAGPVPLRRSHLRRGPVRRRVVAPTHCGRSDGPRWRSSCGW